jgi:hypothetical protein
LRVSGNAAWLRVLAKAEDRAGKFWFERLDDIAKTLVLNAEIANSGSDTLFKYAEMITALPKLQVF